MNIKLRGIISCLCIVLGLPCLATAQTAASAAGEFVANSVPKFITAAKNLGPADTTEMMDVQVWLKPHNREELDALTEELYDPASPQFHNWLKPSDISSRFAPTAEEAQTVGKFLSSHNLPVTAVGPDNFYVRARGTLADVQKAFRVQISKFELNGKTYRANIGNPYVEGAAAALVGSIYGLDNMQYKHPIVAPMTPQKAPPGGNLTEAAHPADSSFFTSNCFTGVDTEHFSGTDFYGNPITASYTGNTYNGTHNPAGCGYTPPEIWSAYNLTGLYKEGFDGTGQTIVIIDWCGSPTIEADANAFSARFGLPPLNSSNFHIYYPFTKPTCGAPDPEINIDVEWAHAIAPGAKIALVIAPTASFVDVDNAETYAIAFQLGNVISGSYGSEEAYTPTDVLNQENFLNELAAALGMSANFASGDSGDYTFGFPSTNLTPGNVNAPASSPFATAVGGVSLALKPDHKIKSQTGWGTNLGYLAFPDTVIDPPFSYFYGGSGGGVSGIFPKPSFQEKLHGTQRQLPDISWLADPYTGGVIAISEPFTFPPIQWTVYGGTSLACPMFSGLWAIANQEAGMPLGQAARHLYSMPAGTITDVLPVGSSTNVKGKITDSAGTTAYSAVQLALPVDGSNTFYSALWDYPLYQDTTYLVTFGTDSGLKTTKGWDFVTGLGTPNGKAFADFFNPAGHQ